MNMWFQRPHLEEGFFERGCLKPSPGRRGSHGNKAREEQKPKIPARVQKQRPRVQAARNPNDGREEPLGPQRAEPVKTKRKAATVEGARAPRRHGARDVTLENGC